MKRHIILLATLLTSSAIWAMTPPAYLSVEGWKKCVSQERLRSAKVICLPSERPYRCSRSSWRELKYIAMDNGIARCDEDDNGIGSSGPIGSAPGMGSAPTNGD